MFTINTGTDRGFNQILLHDDLRGTFASVVPDCGAVLQDFSMTKNGIRHHILASYTDLGEFRNQLTEKGFMGCKLSPFAGRLRNGRFIFQDEVYQTGRFFLGKHALHGLLYDAAYEVECQETGRDFAELTLKHAYRGQQPGFPFHFNCRIIYRLENDNRLIVSTKIESKDNRPFPLQDGWHPYFRFGNKTDELWLQLDSSAVAKTDEELIPTGKWTADTSFQTAKPIGNQHFDHCFRLDDPVHKPALILKDPQSGIGLQVFVRKGYPYLQLYTPSDRRSIAVEPMSAPPDMFNNKMGWLVLEPENLQEFVVAYQVTGC